MNLEKSGNPAFSEKFLKDLTAQTDTMTFQGAINKTLSLFVLLVLSAIFTWRNVLDENTANATLSYISVGAIGAFIVAMVIIFKSSWAMYLAPLYAILEGLTLGGVSAIFEQYYPGIVLQAVVATLSIFVVLWFVYKMGLIKVTDKFRMIVVGAMFGILAYYLVGWIFSLFGVDISLSNDSGVWGIAFSVILVVVASLNLVLDFDYMRKSSEQKIPKYMEWYFAFALMLTLVWLYMEILNLLYKLQSKD